MTFAILVSLTFFAPIVATTALNIVSLRSIG
jgi:hypothetical protein